MDAGLITAGTGITDAWEFEWTSTDASAVISTPTAKSTSVTFSAAGTFTLTMTATSPNGKVVSVTTSVVVVEPIAWQNSLTMTLGESLVSLTGSGIAAELNGVTDNSGNTNPSATFSGNSDSWTVTCNDGYGIAPNVTSPSFRGLVPGNQVNGIGAVTSYALYFESGNFWRGAVEATSETINGLEVGNYGDTKYEAGCINKAAAEGN